jgi:hypothetical protein
MSQRVNQIAQAFAEKGLNTDRISQSTLILKTPILAGSSSYTFGVLQNQQPILNGEIRLDLQDMFVVTTIAVCFSGTYTVGANAFRGYFFSPPFQADLASLPMMALYNGTLSCDINNVRYLDRWDIMRHYNAGQTQLQGFAGAATEFFQQNQIAGNTSGFFPVDPGIVLNGDAKNTFTIQMPTNQLTPIAGIPFIDPSGAAAVIAIDELAIIARGYLGQNSSKSN